MLGKRIITPGLVPSVANLSGTITVGATSVNATARYNAADATVLAWPKWTYGTDLAITGSGADPSVGQASPLSGSENKSILYNSKYHIISDTSKNDITADDFFFEAIVKMPSSGVTTYACYKYHSGTTTGYAIRLLGPSKLAQLLVYKSGYTTATISSPVINNGDWSYICFAGNRDEASANGAFGYASGVPDGGVNISTINASIANAASFNFGLVAALQIAYFGMWLQTNLWSSGTTGKSEMDALAASRAALVKWW